MKYLTILLLLSGCSNYNCPDVVWKYSYGQKITIPDGFYKAREVKIIKPRVWFNSNTCNVPSYGLILDDISIILKETEIDNILNKKIQISTQNILQPKYPFVGYGICDVYPQSKVCKKETK